MESMQSRWMKVCVHIHKYVLMTFLKFYETYIYEEFFVGFVELLDMSVCGQVNLENYMLCIFCVVFKIFWGLKCPPKVNGTHFKGSFD